MSGDTFFSGIFCSTGQFSLPDKNTCENVSYAVNCAYVPIS